MEQVSHFHYYESKELNTKFLKLNLVDTRDSFMTFILPNDKEGLADLETKIEQVLVEHPYSFQKVHIFLPKFKIQTTIKFKSILQSLGILDAFEDGADFTEIGTNQEPLKIDNIFQKVYIEVNQEGANTAFGKRYGVSSGFLNFEPIAPFRADHPFLFHISLHGEIVFIGRFTSISEMNNITPKKDVLIESIHQSKIKPKIDIQEGPIISIVDEYTCPCNLN